MNEAAIDQYSDKMMCDIDPWFWAWHNQIKLQSGAYSLPGHEWQVEPMQSTARKRVARKAAQIGFSELEILRTLHGMISERYPTGCLYLFPTQDDVSDFSKARFNPLIADNPQQIGKYVKSTDSTNIKRIGTGMLYLRGARLTANVEGIKKDASKLRSIPVDKIVLDERDLMDNAAVDMAIERMSHSKVREYVSFSTPTIPDYGIDKEYQESDQRVWMIRCQKCNHETCMELEFPESLGIRADGTVFRKCSKCGSEIFPADGHWVAQCPDNEVVGWWISQLCSMYIPPIEILNAYNEPNNGNLQEVYNSKLGMAYIDAENMLTRSDVYARCGKDMMLTRHEGPCAMGVDVGKVLHVVIGYRLNKVQTKVIYIGRVGEFEDLHDLIKRFHVDVAMIDLYPETRKVREFQKSEPGKILGCQYRDQMTGGEVIDERSSVMTVARTEVCDATHTQIVDDYMELPRRNPEIEEYALEMSNIAKVQEEDSRSGKPVFRYRKLGADHYRHATNYFFLASQLIETQENIRKYDLTTHTDEDQSYDILRHGM